MTERRRYWTARGGGLVGIAIVAVVAAFALHGRQAEPPSAVRLVPSPAPMASAAAPARPPSGNAPAARAPADTDLASVTRPAPEPLDRDRLSVREVRRMVEHVVETRLARPLAAEDYDRLTDAVMRLRAASRHLRAAPESSTGDDARDLEHAALVAALADIRTITGVPPSELGGVFLPDDAGTGSAESP